MYACNMPLLRGRMMIRCTVDGVFPEYSNGLRLRIRPHTQVDPLSGIPRGIPPPQAPKSYHHVWTVCAIVVSSTDGPNQVFSQVAVRSLMYIGIHTGIFVPHVESPPIHLCIEKTMKIMLECVNMISRSIIVVSVIRRRALFAKQLFIPQHLSILLSAECCTCTPPILCNPHCLT